MSKYEHELTGLQEQIAADLGTHASMQIVEILERTFTLTDNAEMRATVAIKVLDGVSICVGATLARFVGESFLDYWQDPHHHALEALTHIRDKHQKRIGKNVKKA